MKHLLRCLLWLMPVWQVASAADFSEAERQWMKAHPVVTYAIDPYWPVEFIDDRQHRGLTREYLDHIAQVSGLRFERVAVDHWRDTLDGLSNGRIQLSSAVSPRLMDAQSRAALLVSSAYFVGSTLVISRSDAPILFHLGHWQGKRIAIKGGGGFEQYLRQHYPHFELLLIGDVNEALEAVARGHADAAIGLDAAVLPIIARQYAGQLHIAGALADMPVEIAMGVSTLAPELLSIVNKSLATLTAGGTDALHDKWIAGNDYGSPSWRALLRHYGLELGGASLLLIALALLAQRARAAQRKAQRSEAQTSEFLAMMSHEIRTPMNALIASVEMLHYSRLEPRERELAALANSAAVNLLELVDDVLEVARLDARQLRLNPQPTDLQLLAAGVADIHRPSAQAKGVALSFEASGLSAVQLRVDPIRIRQILSNLLSNAVKFTEQGSVTLHAVFTGSRGAAEGTLTLSVRDTGIGIDENQQARLFRAFAQAQGASARRYGGFGLGLSICKQLVELMGGKILLRSTLGLGTSISITLPVQCTPRDAGEIRRTPEPRALPGAGSGRGWVLIVEDQAVNQQALALQLKTLGYRSRLVADGPQALACLESGTVPDLILLDCYLPGMSGFEVAQRIRQLESQRQIDAVPIVAISAASDDAHRLRCIECGMDVTLSKPVRLEQLSELLQFWLAAPAPGFELSSQDQQCLEQMFIESSDEDVAAIALALRNKDLDSLLHHVHRLHGAALTLGAEPLVAVLKAFETDIRNNQHIPADSPQRLAHLQRELNDYRCSA